MVSFVSILSIGLLALSAVAAPVENLTKRDSTCGDNYYTDDQISAAADQSCSYYQDGTTAGSSTYPHTYNDYEGFTFPVDGPYLEFPIKESGVYSGGSPGADRVIINTDCELAGVITHTGASGNDFVECD